MSQLIKLRGLGKSYGRQRVLSDLNLSIAQGEFLTLLGPSGSGKSTALMILAGLVKPSCGCIELNGQDITQLPAEARNFGVVFQGYALFPHMTVAQNIAYPLRLRKCCADEIELRVSALLQRVGLAGMGKRSIAQLSGGQQQRVALARALVFDPQLLLLDEPLSALDRRLRQEMQEELARIQQEFGTTLLLVTHDQEEALALSDRIALLNQGRLEQLGTPWQLYQQPANVFAARFLGDTNLLPVRVLGRQGGELLCDYQSYSLRTTCPQQAKHGEMRYLAIRPEHIELYPADIASFNNGLYARLDRVSYQGTHIKLKLNVNPSGQLSLRLSTGHPLAGTLLCGERYRCCWLPQHSHLLSA